MKNKIVIILCILSFSVFLVSCSLKEEKNISNSKSNNKKLKYKLEEKSKFANKEKWTKDNIISLLIKNNVLEKNLVFSDKEFGSKIQAHNVNSYGNTNIKNPYCLELTIVYNDGKTVSDEKLMKETVFKIIKTISNNSNNFDFNLALVGIHFSNISNESEQYGNDFYIGINTIKEYFNNDKYKSKNLDIDSESFYKWMEENFTLPEDNSILAEDNSWTTISKMSIPNP